MEVNLYYCEVLCTFMALKPAQEVTPLDHKGLGVCKPLMLCT